MPAPIGNKYAVGADNGRPPVFETVEDFSNACNEYFEYIKGESHFEEMKFTVDGVETFKDVEVWDRVPEPATITGLALFLGFDSRQSLFDYGKKEVFSYTVKRAKARVEHGYEKALWNDKPTGAIFALKNMGWNDNLDITSGGDKIQPDLSKFSTEQLALLDQMQRMSSNDA